MAKTARLTLTGTLVMLLAASTGAMAQQLTQDFELATFPPTGWVVRNQSGVIGSNTACWNRFSGTTPWAPHGGTGQSGANFNCASGANTISGWLITSQLTALQNGNTLTFWTRKASPDSFVDSLQVRLCLDTTPGSCGAAGSTGTTATDVGGFTTVLLEINPTQVTGVYPTTYTQFTATVTGLPAGNNAGRIAFRYFVTSGGPGGTGSDLISIDDINLTDVTPVELLEFETF